MLKKHLVLMVVMSSLVLVTGLVMAEPLSISFDDPDDAARVINPYDAWQISVATDPFGQRALFFGSGSAAQRLPNSYNEYRFALLDYPAVDDFELSVSTLGVGGAAPNRPDRNGGNRSASLFFGFQDFDNYWGVFYSYTVNTRVFRVVNGVEQVICQPGLENVYNPSNTQYQNIKMTLTTEGDNKVVRAWIDGETTALDMCTFPAADYTPGRVGAGGNAWSNVQSWFLKDFYVNSL